MRKLKIEEKSAEEALRTFVNDIHAESTNLTWLFICDLLNELADYAWDQNIKEVVNREANKKAGLASLKKKGKP